MQEQVRLGEILVGAGALNSAQIEKALGYSRTIGVPIGQALISEGLLRPSDLQAAITIQSLIMDGLIPKEFGFSILSDVLQHKQTLDEALQPLGDTISTSVRYRLGDLLVQSGIATREYIDSALELSIDEGLPLGHILIRQCKIRTAVVDGALQLQQELRLGTIDFDQALVALGELHAD